MQLAQARADGISFAYCAYLEHYHALIKVINETVFSAHMPERDFEISMDSGCGISVKFKDFGGISGFHGDFRGQCMRFRVVADPSHTDQVP